MNTLLLVLSLLGRPALAADAQKVEPPCPKALVVDETYKVMLEKATLYVVSVDKRCGILNLRGENVRSSPNFHAGFKYSPKIMVVVQLDARQKPNEIVRFDERRAKKGTLDDLAAGRPVVFVNWTNGKPIEMASVFVPAPPKNK